MSLPDEGASDQIRSVDGIYVTANTDHLTFTVMKAMNGSGNAPDYQLTRDAASNAINAEGGNDVYSADATGSLVIDEAYGQIVMIDSSVDHVLKGSAGTN